MRPVFHAPGAGTGVVDAESVREQDVPVDSIAVHTGNPCLGGRMAAKLYGLARV